MCTHKRYLVLLYLSLGTLSFEQRNMAGWLSVSIIRPGVLKVNVIFYYCQQLGSMSASCQVETQYTDTHNHL